MPILSFCKRTIFYVMWVNGLEGMAFFYDLFFHDRPSHAFWNEQYNWLPVVATVVVASLALSVLHVVLERRRPLRYRLPAASYGLERAGV